MNALVLQCGGPTAVVNHTLAGLVRRWRDVVAGGTLYGGRFALAALGTGDWLTLCGASHSRAGRVPEDAGVDETWLRRIEATSGMALGGGRVRLSDGELDASIALLRDRGVETVFLIGGNGTMAGGRELGARAAAAGLRLRVIGIPKTIDNDIPNTDVSPGFPSAARFLRECVRDVAADVSSMAGYEDVVLVEAMGRHSGWLAAATALARQSAGDAPHLVFVPEQALADDAFLEQVREQHARTRVCVVTVAEGVRDAAGRFLAAKALEPAAATRAVERDAGGQVILGRSGGPLPYLAALVRNRLGLRCRLVRPDVLQRCSQAHVSPLDRHIARLAGAAAADAALDRQWREPLMIALRADGDAWRSEPVPLAEIRGERTLPLALQSDPAALATFLV